MSRETGYPSKTFLIWSAANALWFGVLGLISLSSPHLPWIPAWIVTALLLSLPVSLVQWIGLRWLFPISPIWVLSVPAGVLLWEILLFRVNLFWFWQNDESIAALTIPYLLLGLLIGLLQWLILRRRFSGSSLWLLGSTIGAGGGLWLILVTDLIDQSGFLAAIVAVLVYIVATGGILTWLLSSQAKSQSGATSAA
ncbi:MAG: hypothetical protein P8074_23115 [Anaerolineales bacterium]